jgi:hypothetical protein
VSTTNARRVFFLTTGGYTMRSAVCASTTDMKNWTDHGVVFQVPANAS